MDRLSVFGIFLALASIVGGFFIEGGGLSALVQLSSLVVVLGGTVGAVMFQSSSALFIDAIKMARLAFYPPKFDVNEGIERVSDWASKARQKGFLVLEDEGQSDNDPFIRKGLSLLVDGIEPEQLKKELNLEIDCYRDIRLQYADVYESMGGYAPTIGILGAVLGLIQAMSHLKNPELLGGGIATAFVATIYGVGFANLFFLPLAGKLRAVIDADTRYKEMLCEGLYAIANGEAPGVISNRLQAYRHSTF